MKKLVTLIAFCAMLTSLTLTAYASFEDVSATHANSDAILYVQSEGIVQGYEDGTYKPEALINRAEFTKIIIESAFDDEVINDCDIDAVVDFTDVTADQWYAKYICVAKENNVIQGYPDGTFKPAGDIIYAEAAKILVKTFGYTTEPVTSEFWYEEFVRVLDAKNTAPDSIAAVDQLISRGEMAEMIYRLKNNITNKTSSRFFEMEDVVEDVVEDLVATELTDEVIKLALVDKLQGTTLEDLAEDTVEVVELDGNYAKVAWVNAGGGSDLYLAYTTDGWVITAMVMGGDPVFCSAIEGYDFPATMIPTCFDDATMELSDR
jgi:hypothetical protein